MKSSHSVWGLGNVIPEYWKNCSELVWFILILFGTNERYVSSLKDPLDWIVGLICDNLILLKDLAVVTDPCSGPLFRHWREDDRYLRWWHKEDSLFSLRRGNLKDNAISSVEEPINQIELVRHSSNSFCGDVRGPITFHPICESVDKCDAIGFFFSRRKWPNYVD